MTLETNSISDSLNPDQAMGQLKDSEGDVIVAVAERLASESALVDVNVDIAAKTTRGGRGQGDFYTFQKTSYGSFMMVGDLGAAGECSYAVMQLLPSAIAQAASGHHDPDPLALLSAVSAVIYRNLVEEDLVATLSVATWDSSTNDVAVSAAGRCPLLYASGSGVRQLESSDAPIGTSARLSGIPEVVSLAPGDFLLLGTDGLVSQEDKEGMDVGLPRLAQSLLDSRGLAAADIVADVSAMVKTHGQGTDQLDDRTALVIARPFETA